MILEHLMYPTGVSTPKKSDSKKWPIVGNDLLEHRSWRVTWSIRMKKPFNPLIEGLDLAKSGGGRVKSAQIHNLLTKLYLHLETGDLKDFARLVDVLKLPSFYRLLMAIKGNLRAILHP
jgi:hypothetical protein